jgi:hypothetical protein
MYSPIRASKKNETGCKASLVFWKLKKKDQVKGTINSFSKINEQIQVKRKTLNTVCNCLYSNLYKPSAKNIKL